MVSGPSGQERQGLNNSDFSRADERNNGSSTNKVKTVTGTCTPCAPEIM